MIRVPGSRSELEDVESFHESRLRTQAKPIEMLPAFSSQPNTPRVIQRKPSLSRELPKEVSKAPPTPIVEESAAEEPPSTTKQLCFLIFLPLFVLAVGLWSNSSSVTTIPVGIIHKPDIMVNWALPDFGAEILPKTRLGDLSDSLIVKYIGPKPPLEQLLRPADPPQLCMSVPPGSKIILSLPKTVDIHKIVLQTMQAPISGVVRIWDGEKMSSVDQTEVLARGSTAIQIQRYGSLIEVLLEGEGCIYGIQVWGY